jgi:hypothetical protein
MVSKYRDILEPPTEFHPQQTTAANVQQPAATQGKKFHRKLSKI